MPQKQTHAYHNKSSTIFVIGFTLLLLVATLIGWFETGPLNAFLYMLFIYAFWYSFRLVFQMWRGISSHEHILVKLLLSLLAYPLGTAIILYSTFIIAGISLLAVQKINEATGADILTEEVFVGVILLTLIAILFRRRVQIPGLSKMESYGMSWAISLYSALFVGFAAFVAVDISGLDDNTQIPPAILVAIYFQYIAQYVMVQTDYYVKSRAYEIKLWQRFQSTHAETDAAQGAPNSVIAVLIRFLPLWVSMLATWIAFALSA